MSKRSSSSRESDNAVADNTHFALEPIVETSEGESSDESYYSGLGSEPSTDDEEVSDLEDSVSESGSGHDEPEAVHRDAWIGAEDTDTSDEEEIRNTVGNIPLEWYEDYPHIGYDIEGKRIMKPAKVDELDDFLSKMDDPAYWRTIRDPLSGKEVVLTDEQMDMIQRVQKSQFPVQEVDHYEPYVDHFTSEKQLHPLSNVPKPKSSFEPSKWEHRQVVKLAHAIRMGWIKPRTSTHPQRPKFYTLWGEGDQGDDKRHRMHIPAPRMKLPGHAESYNPPPEYLPTEEEAKEWRDQDPEDRDSNYLPHKYNSLREVPAYSQFIQERFERCLDLYLCPRQRRMRVQVDPEDLIPKLPKPSELRPFPTTESIVYKGHTGLVRCLSVDPSGQWLASGSDDCSVRLWEVSTGRCLNVLSLPSKLVAVEFSPSVKHSLLAIAVEKCAYVFNHTLGDRLVVSNADQYLRALSLQSESSAGAEWTRLTEKQRDGWICVKHTKAVKQVCWHSKGDYFATVVGDAAGCEVIIHQLSKSRSQNPFKKMKGAVQKVAFHPSRPLFFVATQTYIKVYDLAKQELVKKLQSGMKWISSLAVHPTGDHLLVGSYDKRLSWFDLDLSSKPYRVLRFHQQAVRGVCYHPRYPLFASCSDDAAVIVCHGRVFNDLMQNPLIVPVKQLKGTSIVNSLGVLDCQFHPSQPWIFTAGADSTLRLYSS